MTSGLWTSEDARDATGGKLINSWIAGGVSIDSRTLGSGDLFVAITGPNFNGHDFIPAAIAGGCSAVLAAKKPESDIPGLVVKDTIRGLSDLAVFARSRSVARVIAVTGSAGKTGTKEALKLLLSESGLTHVSDLSYNNFIGVSLSLARLPPEANYAVFEVGMNSPGEIIPLSKMIRPHVAVITTVEAAHLESFDSVKSIARAKSEIFDSLEPGGHAVLNCDNEYFDLISSLAKQSGAEIVKFGERSDADARLMKCVLQNDCSTVTADICGTQITYKVGIPGRHWVQNSLAILAAANTVGVDLDRASLALNHIRPGPGRGEQTSVVTLNGTFDLIDESYNANPASMCAALKTLNLTTILREGRRIAVLGDMLELGSDSEKLHKDLATLLEVKNLDLVFTVGNFSKSLHDSLPIHLRGGHSENSDKAASLLVKTVQPGDVVLIKGSNAIGMSKIKKALLDLSERGAA